MHEQAPSPFCHIAIPAPDLEKAKLFYEQVFGWKVQANTPGPKYWFFESGNVGGAFNGNTKPAAGAVVLVLRVQNMEDAIAKIRERGGTITQEPSLIGEASPGRDAYFRDPNGNEMGVYVDV
jgi:predicted enzyme related to lactoylglutathione lyase